MQRIKGVCRLCKTYTFLVRGYGLCLLCYVRSRR